MLLKLLGKAILQSIHDLKIHYLLSMMGGVYLSIFHFRSLELLLIYSLKTCSCSFPEPQEGSSNRIMHRTLGQVRTASSVLVPSLFWGLNVHICWPSVWERPQNYGCQTLHGRNLLDFFPKATAGKSGHPGGHHEEPLTDGPHTHWPHATAPVWPS